MDPHFFADPDPDPESQNNADPADPDPDPDPKHCFNTKTFPNSVNRTQKNTLVLDEKVIFKREVGFFFSKIFAMF